MSLIQIMSIDALLANGLSASGMISSGGSIDAPTTGNRGNRKMWTVSKGSTGTCALTWSWARPPAAGATRLTLGFAVAPVPANDQIGFFRVGIGTAGNDIFMLSKSGTTLTLHNAGLTALATVANVFTKPAVGYPNDPWYFIEVRWTSGSATNTTIDVVVDGVTVISGANSFVSGGLPSNSLNSARWYMQSAQFLPIMDFYLADDTGTVNNAFLGDCRVEYLTPQAAGALQEWSLAVGASKISAVTSADDDTSYIRSTALGERDTYTLTDLVSTTGTIRGVEVTNIAKQESSGNQRLGAVVRVAGTAYVSATGVQPLQGTYRVCPTSFDLSPATSAAWTAAEVNALEAGPVIIS